MAKLQENKSSFSIIIPQNIIKAMGWKKGSVLLLIPDPKKNEITIRG